MTDTRYDYRLYCKTESRWVEGTTKDTPDACFNNNSHVIEPTSITLLKTVSPNFVVLKEEEIVTNGNYKCECVAFDCAPGTTTHEISFPYAINLLSTASVLGDEHKGNVLNVFFVPDSVIGVTTLPDGANHDSELIVSSAASVNIISGLNVSVSDYLGSEDLGTVINVDNTKITVSADPSRPFIDAVATFSYNEKNVNISTIGNTVTVDDATGIFSGLNISAIEDAVITAVNGNTLTTSIPLTGSTARIWYTSFSTQTMREVRPLTVLATNETAVQYAQIGFHVKLTDGVNTNLLGRVTQVDKARRHLYVENAPTLSFNPGAYIQVTRYFIENFEFSGAGAYDFSKGRNKGSYIDKGRRGKFQYENKSNTTVRFVMKLEYLH